MKKTLDDLPEDQYSPASLSSDSELEASSWLTAGRLRFAEAYCEGDDLYEELFTEALSR